MFVVAKWSVENILLFGSNTATDSSKAEIVKEFTLITHITYKYIYNLGILVIYALYNYIYYTFEMQADWLRNSNISHDTIDHVINNITNTVTNNVTNFLSVILNKINYIFS